MKLLELFTEFTVRDSQFTQAMSRNKDLAFKLKGNLDSVSRSARRALVVLGAIGGIAVKIASDAEESGSKFIAVFKEESKAAEQFAEVLAGKTQRSVINLKASLAGIQDTFVPLGFARKRARELSQAMVELAVDVASFQNASDEDVIRDFQSALVGNTETVRKYGIVITQATLTQELLRQGLNKTASTATELEKVQARLNLILAGTSDAQGDAARTSESFANQMKGLGAVTQELAVAIGNALIPPIKELIKRLKELLPKITEWIDKNQKLVTGLAVAGFGVTGLVAVMQPFIQIVADGIVVVGSLTLAFGKLFTFLATVPLPVIAKLVGGIITLGLQLGAISLAVIAVTIAWNKWTKFLEDTSAIEKATKATGDLIDKQIENFKLLERIPEVPADSKLIDGKLVKLKGPEDVESGRRIEEELKSQKRLDDASKRQFREFEAINKTTEIENRRSLEARLISIKEFIAERGRILTIRKTAALFDIVSDTETTADEKRTRRIELDEDFARRAIEIKQRETELFKSEEERKTRIAEVELRKRMKADSESKKDLRKFERDLLKDEILAQREKKKAAAEDIKGERGKLREAQKRAKDSRITFTGVIQRLRQIQIGLGGEKENKLVVEAKKRLKVAEDTLKVQKQQLDELKNQLPLMGA